MDASNLEKQIRTLRRKLERSESHRMALEKLRDSDMLLYKKLNDDIEQARASLERANAELRRTQAQLVQAEKLASLGQLTAGIAHEIKNPLNFINNFAEVNVELADELADTAGDDLEEELGALLTDLRDNSNRVLEYGKRADGIVRAMMDLAGPGADQHSPTDVNALAREAIQRLVESRREDLSARHVQVDSILSPDAGTVDAAREELLLALRNLVDNAVDAVIERGRSKSAAGDAGYLPRVTLVTTRNASHVIVRVEDNGSGIPEGSTERIFEPFFTTKPTGKGNVGLGLSRAFDTITRGHGGTLTAHAMDDGITAFVVALPV